jgi:SAM-dependent methyltransferase
VPRFVERDVYAGSFGFQWNRFAQVQLDSANGSQGSRARFIAEVPWSGELDGKWVVDAGCGSGRFAEVAAGLGADVLAVDLSDAVDAAHRNLVEQPHAHVLQADLRSLPVAPRSIEYLYCIGVLQHTPDPMASARSLVELLAPGGQFAFTIYGRKPWTRLYPKYLLRPLTKRIPKPTLLRWIERVMPVVFPVTSVLFSLPVLGRAFRFAIPVANYPGRTDLPREVRYQEAVLDTFDMLSPEYDHPMTPAEIRLAVADLCEELVVHDSQPLLVSGTRRA